MGEGFNKKNGKAEEMLTRFNFFGRVSSKERGQSAKDS